MSYEDKNQSQAAATKTSLADKALADKARKNPAENHPDYSYLDKLAAITKILQNR